MTTGMLQETVQTSPSGSGPRFRPYASPNHHVTKGRYITSNDPRGYIPVYEYPLNGQWIMMDIDDGYILWTGIWKALGNSKADIVKMIDSQPDLAPLIRRVRGGYLKIQGTWMPYEVALKLSRRVAWAIRDDLIPLFGPTFPSTCLSPEQPGYGQVVPTGQGRRRARRSTQTSVMQMPRAPAGWTVVTPNTNMPISPAPGRDLPPSLHPVNLRTVDYPVSSPYPSNLHLHSPVINSAESSRDANMYGGAYASHPPSSYRKLSAPGKIGLSLDTRSLAMRDSSSEPPLKENIKLPPIRAPSSSDHGDSPYALPPISAMEDLRGSITQDSAVVLQRLRMDDNHYSSTGRSSQEQPWARRHSLSSHPSLSKSIDTSPRFRPYNSPRSYQEQSGYRGRSPSTSSYDQRRQDNYFHESQPVRSDASLEGDSTSNPSPTSPTTPNSVSENEERRYSQTHYNDSVIHGKSFPGNAGRLGQQWSGIGLHMDSHGRISEPETFSVRRHSYEVHSDGDSVHPHRPW
ncbi:hypothetical protein CPB84DRAFT_1733850 [Gymnopilus junonius]|uniref:HTH APSES-type domain-containing protein n=1 Tax=Gymnopilus junonius TaxID=109634 RepID=A0A9P5NG97_GYMJU|nr:hypothetical protein CPB84DRAFT_1733850 [Gymnopilus junonius]